MPATYEPIASSSLSAASSVTFSSIPGTYTDLVVMYQITNSLGNQNTILRFNSDSGTNYSTTFLFGNGSTAGSARYSNLSGGLIDPYGYPGSTANSIGTINVMSYANTNVFKTAINSVSRADTEVLRGVHLWRSTAAITNILMYPGSGTITGTVNLYGIKAA